jgi:hypothetical protein
MRLSAGEEAGWGAFRDNRRGPATTPAASDARNFRRFCMVGSSEVGNAYIIWFGEGGARYGSALKANERHSYETT